jgi:aminopeptidase YwaD
MPSPSEPTARGLQKPYAALPLTWAAIVLLLTLTPSADMPRTPAWELLSFDTAAHAGVFVVLAILSWVSLRRQGRWPQLARQAGATVLLLCLLFGGLIEILQYIMHVGRHAEWTDLLGDTLGAMLGLGLLGLLPRNARRWVSPNVASLLLLPGVVVASLLAPHASAAQDMDRVRGTIRKLASSGLHGRGYVKQGEHKAAAYLRGRFRQLGLQPLAPDYTQPFELAMNTFPGSISASSRNDGSHLSLAWTVGRDIIAAPNSGNGRVDGRIQALDTTVFTSPSRQQWYQRQPLSNQVLWMRQADAAQLNRLPLALQQHLDSAAAWITVVPKLTASLAATQAAQPRIELLEKAVPNRVINSVRYGQVAQTPYNSVNLMASIQIDAKLQRHYPTQNLAAVIRGSTQPDSFLVVTAHYDHLGMMGRKSYFPGANDNASGVAMLLELAAYYTRPENHPACSIVFLLFGAEEAGLVGSSYFVQHPLVPLPFIKFLLNLDLLGTGEEGITVVNGKLLPAAFARLQRLNAAGHYLPSIGARGRAANSDHFPFSEAGVPAFFIYTRGGSKAYHDVQDRPEALSLAGFEGVFSLLRDFIKESGAGPRRP